MSSAGRTRLTAQRGHPVDPAAAVEIAELLADSPRSRDELIERLQDLQDTSGHLSADDGLKTRQLFNAFAFAAVVAALLAAPWSVVSAAAPDGEALYLRHCSACHQTEGLGGIGAPLSPAKLVQVSDEYLYKTIRLGRPGRVMPAFADLSEAEIDAVIGHVRRLTGTSHRADFDRSTTGDAESGAALFAEHCAGCHGPKGTGEGLGTGVTLSRKRSFLIMPPAIANPAFLAAATDSQIRGIVSNGIAGTVMPSFRDQLTPGQIDDIIAHLRALAASVEPPPTPESPTAPSFILVSNKDFDATVAAVKSALVGYNFRAFPDRYLEQGLTNDADVNRRQVAIRFCNFDKLYTLIRSEPRIGVMLPCRITVLEGKDGSVLLVVPNLDLAATWFNNDDLVQLWEGMKEDFNAALEEVTF